MTDAELAFGHFLYTALYMFGVWGFFRATYLLAGDPMRVILRFLMFKGVL